MTRRKRTAPKGNDPLLRACTACGAGVGQGCQTVGNDSKPLVTRATRLVHAARLEGGDDA